MNLSHLVWAAFVLSSVVAAQQSYVVNATVQKFRLEYRRFKSEWLKKADISFFDVYNALNTTLYEIVTPFEDVKTNWTRMCRNFTEASLGNDTRLVFDTLCENDVLLLENLVLEREKWLTSMFYGEVTTDSPSVAILKKLFTQMELQMSEMWQIYATNSSCVESMIESYLPSYEPVIENVFFLNNETIANISETFKEAKTVGNDSLSIIGRFLFRVTTECADAVELEKCILFFVSTNSKPSCSSIETLLYQNCSTS